MIEQIVKELLIPAEFIQIEKIEDFTVYFTVNKVVCYTAKVTKTGKLKKNSIRRDFA